MNTAADVKEIIRSRGRELGLVGLWEIVHQLEVTEPKKSYLPKLWKWDQVRPLLLDAAKCISLEESDRRVMILSNPGQCPLHHSTNTLYVSYSVYNAKEVATVHRHTANASRFVLEGGGGYTTIEGEKCTMSRGDLIVTPNGTWHDHGNEGDEPVMWIDVLDLPLVEALSASSFEFDYQEVRKTPEGGPERSRQPYQSVTLPLGHSANLYGAGGMKPTFVSHLRGDSLGTPMFVYRWEDAQRSLERLRAYEGSPYDGVMMEYVNPVTGEPVTTTMSFSVQMLRPGEATRRHRHASSACYCCLKGRGRTVVDGLVMEWGENDLFVVPTWAWHQHTNLDPAGDSILYSVSDAPTMKRLGLYREENG